jgi:hypothetical protein
MDGGKGKSSDFRLSQALPTRWSRRVFPQQPQVSESNAREIREHGGQPGIPFDH